MLRSLMVLGLVALAAPAAAQAAPNGPASPQPAPAAAPATPPPAQAPATPEPQRTTASFGDWTLTCIHPDKAPANCEVGQTLFNQGNPFARTVVGRVARTEPLRLAIVVPVNVLLTVIPHMQGGANETGFAPFDLTWRRCLGQVCIADTPLTDEQLHRLRTRTETARVIYEDSTGKEVPLPFGPTGLNQALDALAKEEAQAH